MSIGSISQIITPQEFAAFIEQFGPFKDPLNFAVATSGGPDSLCLAALMHEWGKIYGHHITALIVDHGLRPESTEEATFVRNQLKETGIKAEILTWSGPKPTTRIQETARQARYQLLLNWCQANNCRYLLVGHHMQDQQETAWWRLYRGSDLWGLAGMSALVQQDNINICRPLLHISKTRLKATLARFALTAVEDPSNLNKRFARVQIRQHLAELPDLPVKRLGHLRQAFEGWRTSFIKEHVTISPYGFIKVGFQAFETLTQPFQEFLLQHLLRVIGNRYFPIRRKDMTCLLQELHSQRFAKRTLGGCIIMSQHQELFIIREWHICPELPLSPSSASQTVRWDNRFTLTLAPCQHRFHISSLGETGWRQFCQQQNQPLLEEVPYPARLALPTLWQEDKLFALCHFNAANQIVQSISFHPTHLLFPLPFKILY